jgi:hypothetical protein
MKPAQERRTLLPAVLAITDTTNRSECSFYQLMILNNNTMMHSLPRPLLSNGQYKSAFPYSPCFSNFEAKNESLTLRVLNIFFELQQGTRDFPCRKRESRPITSRTMYYRKRKTLRNLIVDPFLQKGNRCSLWRAQ